MVAAPPRRRGAGFTLIELLIVLAIVALLLTVAVPRYTGALDAANDRALRDNLNVLRVTLDRYYSDKGRYPDTLEELVGARYLRAVPPDPVTGSSATWIAVAPGAPAQGGIADVRSGAPGSNRQGLPYADY